MQVRPFLLAMLPPRSILGLQFFGFATCYRDKLLLVHWGSKGLMAPTFLNEQQAKSRESWESKLFCILFLPLQVSRIPHFQLFYLVDEAGITQAALVIFWTLLFLIWCDDLHRYHRYWAHLVGLSVGTAERKKRLAHWCYSQTLAIAQT